MTNLAAVITRFRSHPFPVSQEALNFMTAPDVTCLANAEPPTGQHVEFLTVGPGWEQRGSGAFAPATESSGPAFMDQDRGAWIMDPQATSWRPRLVWPDETLVYMDEAKL